MIQNNAVQQMYVDPSSQQQVIVTQQRQILVQQPANQMMIPAAAAAQIKPGQTVIVQNPNQAAQRPAQVVLQQANPGQILLSQGQMLVASGGQPGQYVLQNPQNTYVVAQPQTAVVHGQPQTVLVTQTSQQQGTGAKTIIILQQPSANPATHHQKVKHELQMTSYNLRLILKIQ